MIEVVKSRYPDIEVEELYPQPNGLHSNSQLK